MKNIEKDDDDFYEISNLLFEKEDININASDLEDTCTILGMLCDSHCKSTHGVELLLAHKSIDVNKGEYPPLYCACYQMKKEGDYFHQVAKLLLQHPDIDVNTDCLKSDSLLCALCQHVHNSTLGVELILQKDDVNVNKGHPELIAITEGSFALFQLIIKHAKYQDVHEEILLKFLQNTYENPFFKASNIIIETLTILLQKGANPNQPAGLLAYAINFLPFEVCQLLLTYGASPNSGFQLNGNTFSSINSKYDVPRDYLQLMNEGKETALHAAARIASKKKIELLLKYGADKQALWIGWTYSEVREKYETDCLYMYNATIPQIKTHDKGAIVELIKSCRQFMYKNETKDLIALISKSMNAIGNRVLKVTDTCLHCTIAGSFREKTKCFAPDELDFVFWRNTKKALCRSKGNVVYQCIDSLIRSNDKSTQSSDPRLKLVCVQFGNNLSSILFKWKGIEFPNLAVKVHVALCTQNKIAKLSRFKEDALNKEKFPNHHLYSLHRLIDELNRHEKQGFILAKAVRIASIAQPDNLDSFDLEENIKVDDVITTFLLQMCLPNEVDFKDDFNLCLTPYAVACKIYEILLEQIQSRKLHSNFLNETIYFCSDKSDKSCLSDRGCCKHRQMMTAMVAKILSWLQTHGDELKDIDFADDVELDFAETGKLYFIEQEKILCKYKRRVESASTSAEPPRKTMITKTTQQKH